MRNLFGQARQQVEAQVRAVIASGVWAIAGDIPPFTCDDPKGGALDHQTRRAGVFAVRPTRQRVV